MVGRSVGPDSRYRNGSPSTCDMATPTYYSVVIVLDRQLLKFRLGYFNQMPGGCWLS